MSFLKKREKKDEQTVAVSIVSFSKHVVREPKKEEKLLETGMHAGLVSSLYGNNYNQ